MITFEEHWKLVKKEIKNGNEVAFNMEYQDGSSIVFIVPFDKNILGKIDRIRRPAFIGRFVSFEEIKKYIEKDSKEKLKQFKASRIYYVQNIEDCEEYMSEFERKQEFDIKYDIPYIQ